jgi:HSP20 family protein
MIRLRLHADETNDRDPVREVLDSFLGNRPGRPGVRLPSELTWEPATDVVETEGEIVVTVDIAGMNGKDINVVTDGKSLRISGHRRTSPSPGKKQFHKLEIPIGPFERAIELPARVDPSKVTAHYSKGFLQIRIRKLDPADYVRKVRIE